MIEQLATFLGIVGAILIANDDKRGFYIWLLGNPLWIYHGVITQQYGLTLQFIVYTAITLFGIYKWRTK